MAAGFKHILKQYCMPEGQQSTIVRIPGKEGMLAWPAGKYCIPEDELLSFYAAFHAAATQPGSKLALSELATPKRPGLVRLDQPRDHGQGDPGLCAHVLQHACKSGGDTNHF